jgi:hypothetical protein
MNRRIASLCSAGALALLACAALAPAAQAVFGFSELDSTFTNIDGSPATQAGSHPYAQTVTLALNTAPGAEVEIPDGDMKDLTVSLPPGFVGDPGVVAPCSTVDFISESCSPASQLGVTDVTIAAPAPEGLHKELPVYSLTPPPGKVMRLGFTVIKVPVMIDLKVSEVPPYNVLATSLNTSNAVPFYSSVVTVFGTPPGAARPFLTLPRACTGPLATAFEAVSWQEPFAVPATGTSLSHDDAEPANPQGMGGCPKLAFGPTITAQPTAKAASSPTGLDFSLDVKDEGLTNVAGLASSDIRKTVVTLPEGFSVNPSIAEGLNVCTEGQLAQETAFSDPGEGCPNASKIGTVEVETPLLDENVNGSLYQAAPFENPFGNLITLYLVIKNPKLGIIVKQPLKVVPNPVTGQLTTIADEMPQLPFSHFRLHFREGTRSPLATPPACGNYQVIAKLYPWSGGAPVTTTSAFQIITGPGAAACPAGGAPPFHPSLTAGTLNNAAGHYSPFNLRLSRNDGEQEFTRFSIKLPPGITGKLAGIPFCSDAAIAAAKARTGPHGGGEELASPSCPKASEVGRTLVGAGVGPSLAYAPGKVYLVGPYHGSALSIAAITAAKVGPFDLGTVVVREALKVNPETAEVFIDATGSDPIPHIIQGVPVHARDIRAYVDRPQFVLNPTDCTRTSTASTVLGSGLDFGFEADDQPITVTSPFQAADCASLGFAPKLALSLTGGTKRGDTPSFKAVLTARPGDANIGEAQVTLPHSEFLEQSHIKTICTRVQFKEGTVPGEKCPAASVYGFAKAITPLLDEPLQGPVYLRSSSHNLPDLVAALNSGKINIALAGHIDSVKGGRIRNTFEAVPDAPVSTFTLEMQGGKKGLLVNSINLCKSTKRAISHFTGQNGKVYDTNPVLKAQCGKKGKAKKPARQARAAR